MKNFERFIAIDWSGAQQVYTRSIAVASCLRGQDAPALVVPPRRHWSRQDVGAWLKQEAASGIRTLVGIDCNFGYADAVGSRHFGADYTARDHWKRVDELNAGTANYFAGAFWDHPDYAADFWTDTRRPQVFAPSRRLTEIACGETGYGWPESPFKLVFSKQVGRGGLAGMRMIHDIAASTPQVAIWPFDDTDDATLVIAEIYPRLFIRKAGQGNRKIRSTTTLNIALEKLGAGALPEDGTAFDDHATDALVAAAGLRFLCGDGATVPQALAVPSRDARVQREGWIFGVEAAA